MSEPIANIQQEKKQYWFIFFALVALNITVVLTRHIPIIFWIGVITAFSLVLWLFMHLKTERKIIHIIIFITVIPNVIGMIALIVFSSFSVPEGTHYLNFDYKPKEIQGEHAPAAGSEHGEEAPKEEEHHGS
jgi:hypothetical protein